MLRPKQKHSKFEVFLTLKQPKHPWDEAAERANAKRPKQNAATQKISGKNITKQTRTPQTHAITIPLTENSQTPKKPETPLQHQTSTEGFYLCPFCTCWFKHQKDLNFHMKNWCRHK
jgi:hypothetical protein